MLGKKQRSFLLVVVSLGLLYVALRGVPLADVWATLRTADARWVALAVALLLGHYALRALRWQLVVRIMGYSVPFLHLLVALLSGNLANLVVPGAGELTRCGTLQKTDGVPLSYGLSSVIAERSYDLLMMAVGIVLTALVERSLLARLGSAIALGDRLPAFLTLAAIGLGLVLLAGALFKYLARNPTFGTQFVAKVRRFGQQFWAGLVSVNRSGQLGYFVLYTVVLWVVGILTFYVILVALPLSSGITFGGLLTFYSFVSVSGIAAPTQGGVGSFHVAAAYALSLYGLSYAQAVIVASFIHAVQMAANLFLNLIGVAAVSLLLKKGAGSNAPLPSEAKSP